MVPPSARGAPDETRPWISQVVLSRIVDVGGDAFFLVIGVTLTLMSVGLLWLLLYRLFVFLVVEVLGLLRPESGPAVLGTLAFLASLGVLAGFRWTPGKKTTA